MGSHTARKLSVETMLDKAIEDLLESLSSCLCVDGVGDDTRQRKAGWVLGWLGRTRHSTRRGHRSPVRGTDSEEAESRPGATASNRPAGVSQLFDAQNRQFKHPSPFSPASCISALVGDHVELSEFPVLCWSSDRASPNQVQPALRQTLNCRVIPNSIRHMHGTCTLILYLNDKMQSGHDLCLSLSERVVASRLARRAFSLRRPPRISRPWPSSTMHSIPLSNDKARPRPDTSRALLV